MDGTVWALPILASVRAMLNPSSRPGKKGELNGTVLYLSSDASSYVQGQFIVVDGGGSLV